MAKFAEQMLAKYETLPRSSGDTPLNYKRRQRRRMVAAYAPVIRLMSAKKYTGATEFGKPCRNLLHGLLFKRIDQWQAGVDNPAGRRPAQAGQAAAADPRIFLASPPRRKSEVEREFAAVECLMVAVAT